MSKKQNKYADPTARQIKTSLSPSVAASMNKANAYGSHKIPFELNSFTTMISVICQYSVSIGWVSPGSATNGPRHTIMELYHALYDDLVLSLNDRNSLRVVGPNPNVPLWYAELFQALRPKMRYAANRGLHDYKWTNMPEVDSTPMMPDKGLVGVLGDVDLLAPSFEGLPYVQNDVVPTKTESSAALSDFFSACLAQGHKAWGGGNTVYAHDVSAFAQGTSLPAYEFLNTERLYFTETGITANWLAELRLAVCFTGNGTRYAVKTAVLTSQPGGSFGDRLIKKITGYYAANRITRYQLLDIQSFINQTLGVIDGAREKWSLSSVTVGGVAPFEVGDIQAFQVYIFNVLLANFLAVSPAILALAPNASYTPLRWLSQYTRRVDDSLSTDMMPMLVMENLRRLQPTEYEPKDRNFRVSRVVYNVPVWPELSERSDFFGCSGRIWTNHGVFPNTIRIEDFSVTTMPIRYLNAVDVGLDVDAYTAARKFISDGFSKEITPFMPTMPIGPSSEKGKGQNLSLVAKVFPRVFAKDKLGDLVSTPLLKAIETGTIPVSPALKLFFERKIKSVALVTGNTDSLAAPPSSVAMGFRINPNSVKSVARPLYSLILPMVWTSATGVADYNLGMVMSRQDLLYFTPEPQQGSIPQCEIYRVGKANVHDRGASTNSYTELMKIFYNRTDMGLGGAAGDIAKMAGDFLGMGSVGDSLGGMIDSAVGMIPGIGGVNEKLGGITKHGRDIMKPRSAPAKKEKAPARAPAGRPAVRGKK